MYEVIGIWVAGFVLGLEHAFDPDHLIAVSILASENKNVRASAWLGIIWGLGHTTALLIVGTIVLVLKISIPVKMALSLELLVGFMLIALGVNALRKVRIGKSLHNHVHDHPDGMSHQHLHTHHENDHHHQHNHYLHRSFLVGLVHGTAGSAALTLLVLTTIDNLLDGLVFVVIFGSGSIIGMLLVGMVIAIPFRGLAQTSNLSRLLGLGTGLIGIIIGSLIIFQIIFVENLFA